MLKKGPHINKKLFEDQKRKCKTCKEIKPLKNFWKDKSRYQGYDTQCKICSKSRQVNEWGRFGSNPLRMFRRLQQLRHGKRKDFEGSHSLKINKEAFIKWYTSQTKQCYYCNLNLKQFISITPYLTGLAKRAKKFGLDRKDNFKPYTIENIVLCCVNCNRLKGFLFDAKTFKDIAKNYIKPKLDKYLLNVK